MTVRTGAPATHTAKVNYLRQRIDHTIKLSVEKAAAHLLNPAQYPLPPGTESLEYAIIDLLKVLPNRKREKFLDKMKEALNASTAKRQQRYGALAAVDFRKTTAIVGQVEAMPVPDSMKITEEDLAQLKLRSKKAAKTKTVTKTSRGPGVPRQAAPGTILQFSVENITCVETNDRRKDEVSFSAFVVDGTGAQQERGDFFTADFKKGESKSPGAAGTNLFTINLGDSTGGVFPAAFAGSILITEKGLFRGGDSAEKTGAILRIVGKVISAGSIATCFIPAVGLPLAFTILGAGAVLIAIGDIMLFGGDELSQVIPDELLLETPPLAGETFARTVEIGFEDDGFIKSGKYSIALRWTVA